MYELRQANGFRRLVRVSAAWRPMSWFYARTLHHIDRAVYRATRGRATFASWVAGLPIVMLTTTGAKSGRHHTLPLVALPDGDRLVVIASNYGQPHNPSWYYNLRANPRATIAFEGATRDVVARELSGEEREREYARGNSDLPGLDAVPHARRAAADPGAGADAGGLGRAQWRLGSRRRSASAGPGRPGERSAVSGRAGA